MSKLNQFQTACKEIGLNAELRDVMPHTTTLRCVEGGLVVTSMALEVILDPTASVVSVLAVGGATVATLMGGNFILHSYGKRKARAGLAQHMGVTKEGKNE